ncbi:hypothetical protein CTAYLR_004823 [Chrysophaeum taylorii]|uniref:Uncharacterized protein n=1 Tax=Chrysophaeum taylorii TaxID=2483200 RepID=A0AAD7UNC7_9STRA|nr:hypothetical protein CTAYLR_004823 [Chrysophaeum taylorii]
MALDNELWLVFTWYALRGRSSDPERLTTAQLARLCEDCRFFGPRRFSKHDMENACAVLRRRRRREEWRGLAFKEFVSLLAAFSERIYGPSRDDAFERLVTERVFPLAKRRRHPLDIAPVATNADVIRVRRWLEAEIGAVFEYYASRESTRSSTLLWDDLRRFSRDFGLKFSSTDIAEAYLSSLDGRGRLGLEGFWEIILRLALGCCSDFQAAAVERKRHSRPYADLVKSVLLDLYRAQDATVELAASERRVPSGSATDSATIGKRQIRHHRRVCGDLVE